MSENIYVQLKKGVHKLNGQEMLGYARFRMDAEGDFGRVARQQKVIEAIKEELLAPGNVKNLPKFIGAAQGYVTSDLTSSQELKTVLSVVAGGSVSIEKLTIPTKDTYDFNSYRHAGEVIDIDLEKNKQILHDFLQLEE
jgi:anionic cell wall polymer biosynthesis LytR-Cps2A-Psr (LCP) family protein